MGQPQLQSGQRSSLATTIHSRPRARRFGNTKPIIGLVGGIGSGKSTVADEFKRHSGTVIAADALGHEALRQPSIRDAVVRRWGPGILAADGTIDRKRLAAEVFSSSEGRKQLEALVFPWIEERVRAAVAEADASPETRFVLLDAAVMLEAGWGDVCDHLVFVDVPRAERLRRLVENRGWTEAELTAREAAQLPLSEKQARCDFVIDNSGPLAALGPQVERILAGGAADRPTGAVAPICVPVS
jgi:dephospho-CoA kinase